MGLARTKTTSTDSESPFSCTSIGVGPGTPSTHQRAEHFSPHAVPLDQQARALFINASMLAQRLEHPSFADEFARALRRFSQRGFRVFAVTEELRLGALRFDSRSEMLAALRSIGSEDVAPVVEVLVLHNRRDVMPFLNAAARFNIGLATSLLVDVETRYDEVARLAGVSGRRHLDDLPAL